MHRLYRKDDEGLTCGVIGNTTDFGSVESKFEPWQVNKNQFLYVLENAIGQKVLKIVLWCNWQHVCFWIRRVQVRDLTGQHFKSQNLCNQLIAEVFVFQGTPQGTYCFIKLISHRGNLQIGKVLLRSFPDEI